MSEIDSHEELQELLGAYALDAVDADERGRIEDHLQGCARCRAEVEQHREVAAQLAYTGADAPEGLWRRIAAQLDTGPPAGELAAILPLTPRRRPVVAVAGAAAVVAVAVGVLAWQVHRADDQVAGLRRTVAAGSVAQAAAAELADPAARVAVLSSTAAARPGGSRARAGWRPPP